MREKELLEKLRQGEALSLKEQLRLVFGLSYPAIIAQITSVVMQYIDAAMVGQLGAEKAAAIGLMSSSLWLVGGIYSAFSMGYYVQVAHRIGAGEDRKAREIVRHGLLAGALFGLVLMLIALTIYKKMPLWLGGTGEVAVDASHYVLMYALGLPFMVLSYAASGMLQSSGEMKIASGIDMLMCVLDVIFNFILIFPTREISFFGISFTMPGAGLSVIGASLGTVLSVVVGVFIMLYFLLIKNPMLHIRKSDFAHEEGTLRMSLPERISAMVKGDLSKAVKISYPVAIESVIMGSAQVMITAIVAPLGAISIAANSFAITAESFCYMPGYGIAHAATTLIGQSIGAGRKKLAVRFGWLVTGLGMALMALTGVLLYILAPELMAILSPDPDIQALGTMVLRIEAFAEPFFAASIVIGGVFRGTGKTLRPSVCNLVSMWAVRIPMAYFLAPVVGLKGVWIAMCIELTIRGTLFLIMLYLWGRKTGRPGKEEGDGFERIRETEDHIPYQERQDNGTGAEV